MKPSPYATLPDEAELGEQKRCPRCLAWWPARDPEWWLPRIVRGKAWWFAWCRACTYEAAAARKAKKA